MTKKLLFTIPLFLLVVACIGCGGGGTSSSGGGSNNTFNSYYPIVQVSKNGIPWTTTISDAKAGDTVDVSIWCSLNGDTSTNPVTIVSQIPSAASASLDVAATIAAPTFRTAIGHATVASATPLKWTIVPHSEAFYTNQNGVMTNTSFPTGADPLMLHTNAGINLGTMRSGYMYACVVNYVIKAQ